MASRTSVLDVRPLVPPARHAEIHRRYEALKPGESFVIVNDREPLGILAELQGEHFGQFEWNLLEGGPVFRVELERREPSGPRSVSEYLGRDHDRLDAILVEARKAAASGKTGEARSLFEEFVHGLERHIEMEEKILFPTFEKVTGMTGGPTMVMRYEHVEIKKGLGLGRAALAKSDAPAFEAAVVQLLAVLGDHNSKEEQILYPATDAHVGGDPEREDLVRTLQTLGQGSCGCGHSH